MAHFGKDLDDFKGSRCIHIRSSEQTEQFTLYVITVTVGSYSWTVKHRYSEFFELHEKLTASYKLDKSLLPPKKLFGNQSESFIKKRQRELEIYLQTITLYLAQHVPSCLAYFLDFDKYEIHGITQAMAEDLYNRGEALLFSKEPYEVSSLQLYSLTERLKLPEPTCESGDVKKDLGHILDFITRCKHLRVTCQSEAVGMSNILMNKVPFDLTLFKSLQTLNIRGCNMRLIMGLEIVKQTLVKLDVHESTSSMKEVLLQDAHHWKAEDGAIMIGYWHFVTHVDFSYNSFSEIHESIQLLPNMVRLDLSHNCLESIQNLQWLSQLTSLDLSHNNIKNLDSLHTKLGNVKCLRISHNRLEHLHGFAKLFSLQTLDISHNNITTIQELWFVSQLPCIEDLIVTGNIVTNSLDYRTKTLEMFGDRVREVVLDERPSDQKELDTVAVLQALRKAKNVKLVKKSFQNKNPSALSLSDMYGHTTNDLGDTADQRTSRTASPALGNVSRSMPMGGLGYCSASPLSQASMRSYNSLHEEQQSANSPSKGATRGNWTVGEDSLVTGTDPERTVADIHEAEETQDGEFEQVPEAHPFDLGFESLAVTPAPAATAIPGSSSNLVESAGGTSVASPPKLLNKLSSPPKYTEIRRKSDTKNSPKATEKASKKNTKGGGGSPSSQMRMRMSTASNVSELPGMSSPEFVAWMEEQILDNSTQGMVTPDSKSSYSHPCLDGTRAHGDSICDILWCYCEQLSRPKELFPCCAILTRDKVVLERLMVFPGVKTQTALSTEDDVSKSPEALSGALRPVSILHICSIQQLVLGPCHAFMRLEEAFVGKAGTYTLFALEPYSLKKFVEKMLQICHDLDVSSTPDCVDITASSDLLKEISVLEEKFLGLASDRLAAAILVKQVSTNDFCFLVLSENQVYCLDTAFVCWPPPSFESSPDASIAFNILHSFSIKDRINNIKILPLDRVNNTFSNALDSSPARKTVISQTSEVPFQKYQLDLEVILSSSALDSNPTSRGRAIEHPKQQQSTESYLFFSAAHRDLFLDRLTNLRAEQAHRMSPSVREEPEGGNELMLDTNSSCNIVTPTGPTMGGPGKEVEEREDSALLEIKGTDNVWSQSDRSAADEGGLKDDDVMSQGSAHTATSGDNTIYYSASPSENLSVSPMSNFSRASISPPSAGHQVVTRKSTVTHVVANVEVVPAASISAKDAEKTTKSQHSVTLHDKEIEDDFSGTSTDGIAIKEAPIDSSNVKVDLSVVENVTDTTDLDFTLGYARLLRPNSKMEDEIKEEADVDQHLRDCLKSYDLINTLPPKLRPLHLMGGLDLRRFFRTAVADGGYHTMDDKGDSRPIQREEEELRHVLWTCVTPYTNPKHEIITLAMISTKAVYLVSDNTPAPSHKSRPSWMTHTRNQSDSVFAWKSGSGAPGLSSSPISTRSMDQPDSDGAGYSEAVASSFCTSTISSTASNQSGNKETSKNPIVKPYFQFKYDDIKRVDVGVFDQCVRLTGCDADSVFSLVVRDSTKVEIFVQYLKEMLTLHYSQSSRISGNLSKERVDDVEDKDPHTDLYMLSWEGGDDADVYRDDLHRTKSTVEGLVYMHPSKVRFVYPGQDAIRDILYLVNQRANGPQYGKKVSAGSITKLSSSSSAAGWLQDTSLWMYTLCYQLLGDQDKKPVNSQPRAVILTATHFSLSQEDLVTYPLPDFVRGLPETPCHQIVECRAIESLKRVRLYHNNPHQLALTFVDEVEGDIVVDTSIEHFGGTGRSGGGVSPEVTIVLHIQSLQDRDKLSQMLEKLWGQLVTQVGRILDVDRM